MLSAIIYWCSLVLATVLVGIAYVLNQASAASNRLSRRLIAIAERHRT
jgi:hypothetical protein